MEIRSEGHLKKRPVKPEKICGVVSVYKIVLFSS